MIDICYVCCNTVRNVSVANELLWLFAVSDREKKKQRVNSCQLVWEVS